LFVHITSLGTIHHQAITNQWLIFLQVRQVHVSMESRKNMAYYKPLILKMFAVGFMGYHLAL